MRRSSAPPNKSSNDARAARSPRLRSRGSGSRVSSRRARQTASLRPAACRVERASGSIPPPAVTRRTLTQFAFVSLLLTTACAGPGQYVWFSNLPRTDWSSVAGEYVINIGDSIAIRVYQQDDLSTVGKIRRDGRIALPLIGEIMVVGKHPSVVAREIEGKLKQFVVSPRVTVNVEVPQPVTVSTIGEVAHVGTVTLEPPAGMIQALSQAGGLTDYADKSRIFVLRQFPSFQRIRFTYDSIITNQDGAATFPLRSGDVIVFE